MHPEVLYLKDNKFYRMLRSEDGNIVVDKDGKEVIADSPDMFKIRVESREDAKLKGIPLDKAVIKKIVVEHLDVMSSDDFLAELKKIVCSISRIDYKTLIETRGRKNRELVEARNMIMVPYFCVYERSLEFPVTLDQAGMLFGKDHATVINSIKTVNQLLETDRYFKSKYLPVWDLVKRNAKSTRLII